MPTARGAGRELARRIDATPDVAVTMVLPDLASAEREVFARNISGILVIPVNFERDLLHGRQSPVALYADASYFLVYQRIAGGVAAVAKTLGAVVETARLIAFGIDPVLAEAAADPMPLTLVPLFNPQGGYCHLYSAGRLCAYPSANAVDRRRPARHIARQADHGGRSRP